MPLTGAGNSKSKEVARDVVSKEPSNMGKSGSVFRSPADGVLRMALPGVFDGPDFGSFCGGRRVNVNFRLLSDVQGCGQTLMMFGNKKLGIHLLRGAIAFAAVAISLATAGKLWWTPFVLMPLALWMLRGCPACWTIGLIESLAFRIHAITDRSRPPYLRAAHRAGS